MDVRLYIGKNFFSKEQSSTGTGCPQSGGVPILGTVGMWHLGTRSLGMVGLSLVVAEILLPTARRYLGANVAFHAH